MASAVIHMAIANEVNKKIKRNNNELLIGSIAPDISKQIGEDKTRSHFLDNDDDIPNIEQFLIKYKNDLYDDFVMGYFIHLYTDYLWFKYFIPEIYNQNVVKKLDGTYIKCTGRMIDMYIYNDYSNLNIQLLDKYNMNLSIFYNSPPQFKNIIKEIPMEKIQIIIDKTSIIIENTKEHKNFVFDIDNINKFISTSTKLILAKLLELGINISDN